MRELLQALRIFVFTDLKSALLFNLGNDPSESFNVAPQHADVLAEIAKALERHKATIASVKNQLEDAIVEEKVPAKR